MKHDNGKEHTTDIAGIVDDITKEDILKIIKAHELEPFFNGTLDFNLSDNTRKQMYARRPRFKGQCRDSLNRSHHFTTPTRMALSIKRTGSCPVFVKIMGADGMQPEAEITLYDDIASQVIIAYPKAVYAQWGCEENNSVEQNCGYHYDMVVNPGRNLTYDGLYTNTIEYALGHPYSSRSQIYTESCDGSSIDIDLHTDVGNLFYVIENIGECPITVTLENANQQPTSKSTMNKEGLLWGFATRGNKKLKVTCATSGSGGCNFKLGYTYQ